MTGLRRVLAFWVAILVMLPACALHQTGSVVLPSAGGGLSVLSLNLAMREDVDAIVSEMAAVGLDRVDVMLLQEVAGRPGAVDAATELGRRLGMAGIHRTAFARDDGRTVGLATLSRYPLADASTAAAIRRARVSGFLASSIKDRQHWTKPLRGRWSAGQGLSSRPLSSSRR
jgi:hypothetical protein